MTTDNQVKPVSLPSNVKPVPLSDSTRTSGAAIAPDGTAWFAGRDAGLVYSIAPGASKPVSRKVPAPPQDRGQAQPAHIALETITGGKVTAVWVSDQHTGHVYRLDPKDPTGANDTMFDLGPDSQLRGITWDKKRKHVWVADEHGRLVAINTHKREITEDYAVHRPSSGVSHLVAADNGIWFTEYSAGKVCFLHASKYHGNTQDRIREFDFGITTTDPRGHKRAISYPAGIAVGTDNRVWVVAGFQDAAEGSLWYVDNITNADDKADLYHVMSLGDKSQPSDIAVDEAGYLWIILSGMHKVVQLTDRAIVVQDYDLTEGSSPTGIAYDSHDQIWICDAQKANQRVFRLTPIDHIAIANKLKISGDPSEGLVAQDQQLEQLTISVVDDHHKRVERHFILTVEPQSVASFGGQNAVVVKTDPSKGHASVDKMLKVAPAVANGTPFTVHATTRGLSVPADVYKGRVGELVKAVKPVDDVPETVTFGASFKNLEAQVIGHDGKPAGKDVEVVFKIEDDERIAAFGQGQRAVSEYSTVTGERGIARAGLHALHREGDVKVTAHTKLSGPKRSATFQPRHVVPLPDAIGGLDDMDITVNEPSKPYTITVNSEHAPVPNVTVQVLIGVVSGGATDAHLVTKDHPVHDPKDRNLEAYIQTNEKGQATIGDGHDTYIQSSNKGALEVTFRVTQPNAPKARKNLSPTVMDE